MEVQFIQVEILLILRVNKFGCAFVIYHEDNLIKHKVKYIYDYSKYYDPDFFIFWRINSDQLIKFSEINENQTIDKNPIVHFPQYFLDNIYNIYLNRNIIQTRCKTWTFWTIFKKKNPQSRKSRFYTASIFFKYKQITGLLDEYLNNLYSCVSEELEIYPHLIKINTPLFQKTPYLLFKLDRFKKQQTERRINLFQNWDK